MRAIVHYMAAADRRILQAENEDVLQSVRLAADQGDDNVRWYVNEAIDRMTGVNLEISDQMTNDFFAKLRSFNTMGLLQGATLSNLNQLNFIVNKAGFANTIRAAHGLVTKGVDPERAKASGALFNVMMTEFTQPSHAFGKWAMAQLHANGFTASERWMRALSAHLGAQWLRHNSQAFLKNVAKNPNSRKSKSIKKQLERAGIDTDVLLSQNGVTEDDYLQIAQRWANESVGRQDITGTTLGIANDSPFFKTLLQFKQFAFVNLAEMQRQIRNAGSPKAMVARTIGLLGGGQAVGEFTRDLQTLALKWENPLDNENRVPGTLRRAFGDQFGRIIDNQITGLTSIYAIGFMAWLAGEKALKSELIGPSADFLIDLAYKPVNPILSEGDFGEGFDQFRDVVGRRAPFGVSRLIRPKKKETPPGLRQFKGLGGLPGLPSLGGF